MKIVSKDFFTFTGVYIAIYTGACCSSYILLVRKFRTFEMLDMWSPTSKLSDIKLSKIPDVSIYMFHLYENLPVKPYLLNLIFWYLHIFSCVFYDWILSIGHVMFAYLGVSLRQSIFCLIFRCFCGLVFLLTLLDFSLTEFLRGSFLVYFLLGLRKKDTLKRARKKCSSKCNFCNPDISFRKI